jgi:intein/homing endonuclease
MHQIEPTKKQAEFITNTAKFSCYSGGFGSGKCILEGSKVFTVKGLIPIENIKPEDRVYSFNRKEYTESKVKNVIDSGQLQSYTITCQGGYKITVSDKHPFLKAFFSNNHKKSKSITSTDWTPIKELQKGDFIAVPARLPFGYHNISNAELIGYILGDGNIHKSAGIKISIGHDEVRKRISTILPKHIEMKYRSQYDWALCSKQRDQRGYNYNILMRRFKNYGLIGKTSHTKFIPNVFFFAVKNSVIKILSGLFVSDGWTDKKGMHITLTSEELIDGIRVLLLKLGVVSQKCIKKIKYKGAIRIGWTLSITHLIDLEKCLQLELLYKKIKLLETIKIKRQSKFPQRGQNKQWRLNDNLFVRIKSIEKTGVKQMYDLEIKDTHNFVCENILVHNTFAGCLRALVLSQYPKNRGLIGRLCYDDQTEILTEDRGWVLFKDLKPTDKVATLHNGTDLVYEYPISYYMADYEGEMIGINNRNFDLLVTPEHKLWMRRNGNRDGSKTEWQMKQAQDKYGKGGWEMKRNVEWNGGEEYTEDFMEFLGFWFAEGWAGIRKGRHEVILTSKDVEYVKDLLTRNNFEFSTYKKTEDCFNFRLKVDDRVRHLAKSLSGFGKALNKTIPITIKQANKKNLQAFLHGFILGDGHYRTDKHDSTQAWTSSPQLADDLQEIGFKAGYTINVYNRGIKKRTNSYGGKNPEYEITFMQYPFGGIEKKHWYKKNYKGKIYCVQVSTGLIYIRRGLRALWSSNTYPELRSTTRKTFFEVCPAEYYDEANGGQWKPSENYLRLINGSEIMFMHLDTVSEKELLSLNIGWFFIDQAEEIGERVFQVLTSRLRLNTVPARYGFIACNPEPGSWIYDSFKKPFDEGRELKDHFLVDSASWDNPYLPSDYIDTMKQKFPPEMVKRYIEGRWDAFENQIYTTFDDRIHVIKPFTTPKEWEYLFSVDHGMINPTAGLLGSIDYDGNLFIIDEYYKPGIVSEHAKNFHIMTRPYNVSLWVIDPSTRAKTREKNNMPWSVIEEYADFGLYFIPANNEIMAGINRVKEMLQLLPNRINPITMKKPAPHLYIFSNCVNLIGEMKSYQWKKLRGMANKNEMERPEGYRDHACDSLRYLIMSRFPSPNRKKIGDAMIQDAYRGTKNLISESIPKNYQGDELLGKMYGEGITPPLTIGYDE